MIFLNYFFISLINKLIYIFNQLVEVKINDTNNGYTVSIAGLIAKSTVERARQCLFANTVKAPKATSSLYLRALI